MSSLSSLLEIQRSDRLSLPGKLSFHSQLKLLPCVELRAESCRFAPYSWVNSRHIHLAATQREIWFWIQEKFIVFFLNKKKKGFNSTWLSNIEKNEWDKRSYKDQKMEELRWSSLSLTPYGFASLLRPWPDTECFLFKWLLLLIKFPFTNVAHCDYGVFCSAPRQPSD